ncbi:MAG: HNH endonuclease [Verrucomicrobia bacterium]|nr:HNH endonuclease [Verrucomicrobiota bacterium]
MSARLEHRVLVLNRLWQPVNIVGILRAMSLLFRGRASAIHAGPSGHRVYNAEEWLAYSLESPPPSTEAVRSPCIILRVPRVLLLGAYDRVPRREIRFSRRNVYLRDTNTCQYCGRLFRDEELNLDHVVPRDVGGKTNWENIVTACVRCNSRKANRLPEQAGMTLRRAPAKPKWRLVVASSLSMTEVEAWKEFLEVTPSGQLPWRN